MGFSVYGLPTPGLTIELAGLSNNRMVQRVDLDEHGHSEFDSVPSGAYKIRIMDQSGVVLLHGELPLTGERDPMYFKVWHSTRVATVSTSELLRKVPDFAVKAYKQACLARVDNVKHPIKLIEKALSVAPNFAEAENCLGALYGAQGQNEEAVRHFEKALDIDERFEEASFNLAIRLMGLGRYAECEDGLRRTMARGHSRPELQMLLGTCLIIRGVNIAEALDTINRLGDHYPVGRLKRRRSISSDRTFP